MISPHTLKKGPLDFCVQKVCGQQEWEQRNRPPSPRQEVCLRVGLGEDAEGGWNGTVTVVGIYDSGAEMTQNKNSRAGFSKKTLP